MNPFRHTLCLGTLLVLLTGGGAFECQAQLLKFSGKKNAAKNAPAGPPQASCIWRVKGKEATVYLAGSVHLLRPQDHPIPPAYEAVYKDCTEVIFEIDMNLMSDLDAVREIQQKGMLGPDESLEDLVKWKTWRLLKKYIRERTEENPRFAAFQLDKMKPGLAFITISSIESMRIGARPDLGLEQEFFALSKKDAKPVSGLETMEFQLTLFDKLEPDLQDRLLNDALKSAGKMGEIIDQMIAAWKMGDGGGLNEIMSKDMPEGDVLRNILLKKRNENWMPAVEEAIAGKKNIMFLVGAGHLVGGDSVVAMLRKKGYEVEQISHDSKEVVKAPSGPAAVAE